MKINSSWKEKLLDFSGIDTLDVLRIALLDSCSLSKEILCLRDALLKSAERVLHILDDFTVSDGFSLCEGDTLALPEVKLVAVLQVSYADGLTLSAKHPQRSEAIELSGINRAPHEMSDDIGALDIITHIDYMDLNLVSVLDSVLHI